MNLGGPVISQSASFVRIGGELASTATQTCNPLLIPTWIFSVPFMADRTGLGGAIVTAL